MQIQNRGARLACYFVLSLIIFIPIQSTTAAERWLKSEKLRDQYIQSRSTQVAEKRPGWLRATKPGNLELPPALTDEDFPELDSNQVELGKLLFFDKILSGNQNISCATCHHPFAATGDGLSLPVGEGGMGTGVARNTGLDDQAIHLRVPRNAPPVFNLGAKEFTVMFHDGRLSANADAPSGFDSPAGDDLPHGLNNALSAQAMFPVTSDAEMAGNAGENPVADQAAVNNLAGPGGVWDLLAQRLRAIPEYVSLFKKAFDDIDQADDLQFVHVANAIGAFEAAEWRADNSPFDQYLRGDDGAMSANALAGMSLFYTTAGCGSCHSGPFQTNHGFSAVGIPQIGPGKGDNLPGFIDGLDDFGREQVTGNVDDRYRFRVPSLRNVALTGPWGHDGAYNSLRAVVEHFLDPVNSLYNYDTSQAVMPYRRDLSALDFAVMEDDYSVMAMASHIELPASDLTETEVDQLIAFLHALTDKASTDLRSGVPARVPSGLTVFD